MDQFTPVSALLGGGLIGLSVAILLLVNGRIAGISGILSGLVFSDAGTQKGERLWRLCFLIGLVLGCALTLPLGSAPPAPPQGSTYLLIIAGLLVGFGTVLGSGCTSGHGVCGIGRLSPRSIVATLTFMGAAMITVFLMRG